MSATQVGDVSLFAGHDFVWKPSVLRGCVDLVVLKAAFQITDRFSEPITNLRETLRSEYQHDDRQDDQELRDAYICHDKPRL